MRRLTLRKETLTELCPDDLAHVVGGTVRTTTVVASTAVALPERHARQLRQQPAPLRLAHLHALTS